MAANRSETAVVAFSAGEVSPRFSARVDVDMMRQACRRLRNMTLGDFGHANRRPGWQFIAYTKQSEPTSSPPPG